MNELHLFAGSGGGILGGILLGHTCVCAVEIEPYCREILLQRQRDGILPKFPIWDDIRTFDGNPWRGSVDIVCGGFPRQDISCAGKGNGISGERSGLWKEMARVVREVGPRIVFVENSPLLTRRGLGVVLGDFYKLGYDARWGVFSAREVGAYHLRKRIYIMAHAKRGSGKSALCRGDFRMGRKPESVPWNERPESALSRLRGVDDGLARVVDRTNAIRNGQVPAVVKFAWENLINKL